LAGAEAARWIEPDLDVRSRGEADDAVAHLGDLLAAGDVRADRDQVGSRMAVVDAPAG
jgi:hypothetical protein